MRKYYLWIGSVTKSLNFGRKPYAATRHDSFSEKQALKNRESPKDDLKKNFK